MLDAPHSALTYLCSYFPWSVVSIYSSWLSSIQLIFWKYHWSSNIAIFFPNLNKIVTSASTQNLHHNNALASFLYVYFLTRLALNTGWWEIDINGCYSLVKIAFAQISMCKNNRRIWRHNASSSRLREVTYALWWLHYARSEMTVHGNSCEMSDQWLFLTELCVQDIK